MKHNVSVNIFFCLLVRSMHFYGSTGAAHVLCPSSSLLLLFLLLFRTITQCFTSIQIHVLHTCLLYKALWKLDVVAPLRTYLLNGWPLVERGRVGPLDHLEYDVFGNMYKPKNSNYVGADAFNNFAARYRI